jgi:hypothetical protein
MAEWCYVLPLGVLLGRCGLPEQLREGAINLTEEQLYELIRGLLSSIVVDDEWYQMKYPDVAQAIKNGLIRSAKEHFIKSGYFEGRQPGQVKVDEKFYMLKYLDIAEAMHSGDFDSVQEHFDRHGWSEGRLPYDIEW